MLVKFEQNYIVRTTPTFWAVWQRTGFFKTILAKRWRHFGRRFCTMSWNKCLMLNYWFPDYHLSVTQCSKKYGSLTRVTRLKVAPNMADPISIKDPIKTVVLKVVNMSDPISLNENLPVALTRRSSQPRAWWIYALYRGLNLGIKYQIELTWRYHVLIDRVALFQG